MRPVKHALKNIDVKETGINDEHEMDKIKRHLLEIGDRINECLSRYSDPDLIKDWRTNLWIFVSKFTTWTPDRLKNVFKKLAKTRDDRLGLGLTHNQDSNDDSKYKKAMVRDAPSSHSLSNSANPSPSFANKFSKRASGSNSNEYEQAGWCSSSSSSRPLNKPVSTQASSMASSSTSRSNSSRYDVPKSSHHYQSSHHHGWSNNGGESSYNSSSGNRKSWQQAPSNNSSNFSQPSDPYSYMAPNRGWQNASHHSNAPPPHHHQQRNMSSSGSQMSSSHHRSSSSYHHHSAHHHSNGPSHHNNMPTSSSSSSNRKSTDISFKRFGVFWGF